MARRHCHEALRAILAMALSTQLLVPLPVLAATDGSTLLHDRGGSRRAGAELAATSGSIDSATGSARFAVPLEFPQGTGGLTPSLALTYSSANRSPSWVGKGWSLEASRIQRSLKHGVPRYDSTDTFVLDGHDLIPDASVSGRYHTRRESFLRIEFIDGSFSNDDYWKVTSRDGTVSRYGHNSDSSSSRITNGNERFAWLLSSQEDLHGNVIKYTYSSNSGHYYLKEIRYTYRRQTNGSLQSLSGFNDRVIKFVLENSDRPDPFLSYLSGFQDELKKRLDYIDVRVSNKLLRRYEFRYVQSPDSLASLLSEVRQYGTDGDASNPESRATPFVHTFGYQYNKDPELDRTGWGTTDPDLSPGDEGHAASEWNVPPSIYFTRSDHKDGGARLADLNGDGFIDAIREVRIGNASQNDATSGAYLNGPSGFNPVSDPQHRLPVWSKDGRQLAFVRHRTTPFQVEPLGTQIIDLNGDGRADALHMLHGQRRVQGTASSFADDAHYVRGSSGWTEVPLTYTPTGSHNFFIGMVYQAGAVTDPGGSTLPHHSGSTMDIAEINGDSRLDLIAQGDEIFTPDGGANHYFQTRYDALLLHKSTGDGFQPSTDDYQLSQCASASPGTPVDNNYFTCVANNDIGQVVYTYVEFDKVWIQRYDRVGKRHLDVNGDGLDDRVVAKSYALLPEGTGPLQTRRTYLNVGTGFQYSASNWTLPLGVYVDRNDVFQIPRDEGYRFVDINGDGRIDIVRALPGIREVWLAYNAPPFPSPRIPWRKLDPGDPWEVPPGFDFVVNDPMDGERLDSGVRFADVNGDGLVDLVRSVQLEGGGVDQEVSLNQGLVPDLLKEIENPFGGRTSYEYGPSTQYDNTGGDGIPDLPQVIQVVTSVTVDDANGNVGTTQYAYSGGVYDAEDREFRGFAQVVATRPVDGRRTTTTFHQDDARSGLVESVRIEALSDDPAPAWETWLLTETTYTPDDVEPYVSLPETVTRSEYDAAATPRVSRVEYRYDEQAPSPSGDSPITPGNLTATIEFGEVDPDTGADLDTADTRTRQLEYTAPNDTLYLVDRVYRSLLREGGTPGAGTIVREERFYYDDDIDVATDGGKMPTLGELKKHVAVLNHATEPDPTTTFTYDVYGNQKTTTSPLENAGQVDAPEGTATYTYDATFHTFVTQVSNGLGHRSESDYLAAGECDTPPPPPGAGLVHRRAGPNGALNGDHTLVCYDGFGRPKLERGPANLTETTWAYIDIPGAVSVSETTRVTSAGGTRLTTTSLDGFGRAFETFTDGPQSQVVEQRTTYDALGRINAIEEAHFAGETARSTAFEYDFLDRITLTTLPGSRAIETTYDRGVVTLEDPNHNTRTTHADVFGRVDRVVEPDGSYSDATIYLYDIADQLRTLTDRAGNQTVILYDDLGRRRSISDPDTGVTTFDEYDAHGNPERTTNGGTVVTWTYDALDRVRTRQSGGATDSWTYDTATNGLGDFATRTDASGTYQALEYDALGRLKQAQYAMAGKDFLFSATYDPVGRVETRTYPTGRTVRQEYDTSGYLTGIRVEGGTHYASNITWTADGRPAQWTLGNGFQSKTLFDSLTGRVDKIHLIDPFAAVVDAVDYTFDPGDRVDRIDAQVAGLDLAFDFDYDALDRLTIASGPYGAQFADTTLRYAHDSIGNLTCRGAANLADCAASGGTALSYPTSGPRPHAPTTVNGNTVGYTASGSIRSLNGRTYTYSAYDQLLTASQNGSLLAEFTYNAAGRRVRRVDHSGGSARIRHYVTDHFEWDETSGLARTHVSLVGVRIATQTESFSPPNSAAVDFGAPLGPGSIIAVFGTPAAIAALLLLLQLVHLRRRGVPLARPALAGGLAVVFYFSFSLPVLAAAPSGDLNANGRLDVVDGLLSLRIASGDHSPNSHQQVHGDVAPIDAPDGIRDGADAMLILRGIGAPDFDGDGLDSDVEIPWGSSPFRADTDGDGLSDRVEWILATDFGDPDSDGDGTSDGVEIAQGTNPFPLDSDGDGTPDADDDTDFEGVSYRHTDLLGSTTTLLAQDPSIGVVRRAIYRPFGAAVPVLPSGEAIVPEFGFTGQRHEAALGIYDYHARFYDPELGRFLQADPLVPTPFNPQGLNRYAYVLNDPINRIDPTGNFSGSIGLGVGTLSFDSSASSFFGWDWGPSFGFNLNTGTALEPGFGFASLFQIREDSFFDFGVSFPTSLPSLQTAAGIPSIEPVAFRQLGDSGETQVARLARPPGRTNRGRVRQPRFDPNPPRRFEPPGPGISPGLPQSPHEALAEGLDVLSSYFPGVFNARAWREMQDALTRQALRVMYGDFGPRGAHLVPTVEILGEIPEYGVFYDYRTVEVLVIPCCGRPAVIVDSRTQVFDPIFIPTLPAYRE